MARSIKKKPAKKRSGAKNTASKKPLARKKATKKAIPKKKTSSGTAKKKASTAATRTTARNVQKKTTGSRNPVKKATNKKATGVVSSKEKTKKPGRVKTPELIDQNLPPVEEKSPELAQDTSIAPGMDKRSRQRAAIRNYYNHSIGLSNVRKGGIKPSGKKPLW